MVSANAFQSFATELPHINRWRERESDRQEDLDSKEEIDGWNWTDPEVEVFIDQGRTKFGFVDG